MIILGLTPSFNKLNKAQDGHKRRPSKHGPLPEGQAQIKTREEIFKCNQQTKKKSSEYHIMQSQCYTNSLSLVSTISKRLCVTNFV